MGRVINAAGTSIIAFTTEVFNDTLVASPRSDVSTTFDSNGAFRIRLSDFPRGFPEGTPPQHLLIRLSSPAFPPIVRSAFVRPGDAVALGDLMILERDPQVTMIGPEGGVAQDSQGKIEVQIPPGALTQATPIQITPIPTRAQFPTPLPSNTVTMYGVEIEPSGTALTQPATLRFKNTLNLPTTMKIPVGVVDTHFGDWAHEGFATWDGTRFSTTVTHFSTRDANGPRLGELVQIAGDPHDRDKSSSSTCGVGSAVNDSTGALEQSINVPLHSAAGADYSLSLSYSSELGGSVTVGKSPAVSVPQLTYVRSFAAPNIRVACLPAGGGGGSGCGGGGAGNPPCILLSGFVSIRAYDLDQHLKIFNYDVDQSQTEQQDAQDFEPSFNVPLPTGEDGGPPRNGYVPIQLTSNISTQGSGTCIGSGATFGSSASFNMPTQRIPVATGDLLDFPSYKLVQNRRKSPLGAGWALNGIGTLYRSPDGLSADLVHGNGQQESFHPYPVLQQVIPNQGSGNALAVDAQTGEVFWARSSSGIQRIDPISGTATMVASGSLFGGNDAVDFKVTYVGGARRFLVATKAGVFEIENGASRQLATLTGRPGQVPSVAGVGKFAYFAADKIRVGNDSVDSTSVSRVDLTDPARAVVAITPVSAGQMRFDPHGEVHATNYQFLHPSGLSQAFDGGLYVADDRLHAVYHLSPDDAGEVGPNSFVDRILGNGVDTMLVGPGVKLSGLGTSIRMPHALAIAPDGTLYVKGDPMLGGLLAYDPLEKTARWVAFDSTSNSGVTSGLSAFTFLSFYDGPLAPLPGNVVIVPSGGAILRLSVQLSSQFEPTRTLSFTDSGATVLDTNADTVEQYSWRVAKHEAALVSEAHRSGEPIRTIVYKDLDRVDYIQDPVGGRITLGYDGAGHLSTITDAAQRTTHFTVDDSGNLREVIYPSNEARRFEYDNYRMVSATHPDNEQSIYTYQPDGTLLTATKPGGGTTTFQSGYSRPPVYDSATHRIHFESQMTDDRGVQHTLTFDTRGAVISDKYKADGQAYDVENVYAPTLGPGGATEIANRLLRFSYTTVNGLPVSELTTFDALGRVAQLKTSPIGNGANQKIWAPVFDGNGRLARIAWGDGFTDWASSYDATGHLTKVADVPTGATGPETGRRTTYDGFRAQDAQPTSVTNHSIATTLGYDALGLVNSTSDTLGRTTTAVHDGAGNALEVGDGSTTVHYGYDLAGRVTGITDAENNTTTLGYKTAGCGCSNGDRVTSIVTPDLSAGQQWSMTYDADGDLHTTTTPLSQVETYDHNAQRDLTAVIDRADRPTTFTYDALGRKATVTDPANRVGVFAYSLATAARWSGPTLYAQSQSATPPPTGMTDPLADGQYQVGSNVFQTGIDRSRVVFYRDATYQSSQWIGMDSLSRVNIREDRSDLGQAFDSTTPGPFHNASHPFVDELYTYFSPFALAQTKNVSDITGATSGWSTSFQYNPDFDLTSVTAEFLGINGAFLPSVVISRDTAGRFKGISEAINQTNASVSSAVDYKPNGRLNAVSLTTTDPTLTYSGDFCSIPNDPSCFNSRLCDSPSPGAPKRCGLYGIAPVTTSETFTYDARGLVFTRTIPSAGGGSAQYGYDQVGRNLVLSFPDGHQRVQIFDALGRLTSRCYQYTDGSPDHCYTTTYDPVGNPKILTDPDMRQEMEYDALDRVTEVRRYVPPSATTPSYTEHYAYNALGAFSIYDGTIVDDQRPRLSGGGKASAGIPASFAGQAITLDGGGRVTNFNGRTFTYYNLEHTLQSVTTAATNVKQTFIYDGLQRLSYVHQGPPNDAKPTSDDTLVYSDLSSSIAGMVSTPHTGNLTPLPPDRPSTAFHVGYDGVDQPLWITQGPLLAYFEIDAVGNVRRLHGALNSSTPGDLGGYSYTAFGKTISVSDPGGVPPPVSVSQPFQWQGKRLMAPGLYDSRARVWSADLGAFLQPDEYGFLSRGGTLWSWPGQNPFRLHDPSGRDTDASISALQDFLNAAASIPGIGIVFQGPALFGQGARNRAEGISKLANEATFDEGMCQLSRGNFQLGVAGQVIAAGAIVAVGVAGLAQAVAEQGNSALIDGGDLVHHYTTLDKVASIQRTGLWSQSSVTDIGTLSSREAVETLGIKTPPDVVITFRNAGQFVPNRPAIIQPHPLGPGGGLDLINPARVGPGSIVGIRPVSP